MARSCIALIHDLAEAVISDHMPEDTDKVSKNLEENRAMEGLFSLLDEGLKSRYLEIWREWIEGDSEAATLVRQIDKLEMAIQASQYIELGFDKKLLNEFIESAHKTVEDDLLKSILEGLSYDMNS